MRLGDTDRAIARAGLMGRRKSAQLRTQAQAAGWLDPASEPPSDAQLAAALMPARTAPPTPSLAECQGRPNWSDSDRDKKSDHGLIMFGCVG